MNNEKHWLKKALSVKLYSQHQTVVVIVVITKTECIVFDGQDLSCFMLLNLELVIGWLLTHFCFLH